MKKNFLKKIGEVPVTTVALPFPSPTTSLCYKISGTGKFPPVTRKDVQKREKKKHTQVFTTNEPQKTNKENEAHPCSASDVHCFVYTQFAALAIQAGVVEEQACQFLSWSAIRLIRTVCQ